MELSFISWLGFNVTKMQGALSLSLFHAHALQWYHFFVILNGVYARACVCVGCMHVLIKLGGNFLPIMTAEPFHRPL